MKAKKIIVVIFKDAIDYYFHNDVPLDFVLERSDPKTVDVMAVKIIHNMDYNGLGEDFVMDVLSPENKKHLKDYKIEIQMKVKDMPEVVNIIGKNVSIFCDYKNPDQPSLGNNATFFYGSTVFWSQKEPQSFSTRIEDGAVIGRDVRIPGYNTIIGKNTAILSLNNFFEEKNFELIMEEGSYIRSGLRSETKKVDLSTQLSTFYILGKGNKIHKNSIINADVVFTGANEIPAYNEISKNVPLIFSGNNFSVLKSKI